MSSRTWSRPVQTSVEGAAPQRFFLTVKEVDEKVDEESASVCDGEGSMALQVKVEIPDPIAQDMSAEQNPAAGDGLARYIKVAESLGEV